MHQSTPLGFYANSLPTNAHKQCAKTIESKLRSCISPMNRISVENCGNIDLNDAKRIWLACFSDHPELFYYDKSFRIEKAGDMITIHLNLLYQPAQIAAYKTAINEAAHRIFANGVHGKSLWEREKIIFDYLQTHTEYRNDKKPERYNLVGALVEHRAVCEGISKAFCVLCHYAGIACICVSDAEHMWNVVNIHGTTANIDNTAYAKTGKKDVDYSFFNIPDYEMNRFHQRVDCRPFHCTRDTLSYYRHNGLCFENEAQALSFIRQCLKVGTTPIRFKLKSGNIEDTVLRALHNTYYNITYAINPDLNTALITLQ